MEYVYAALLLHSSGKEVSEEGISVILNAVDITPDEVRIKALVTALEGVDIESVLAKAPTAAAVAAPVVAAEAAPAAKAEEVEEEEEEAEESGIEGLGALFG